MLPFIDIFNKIKKKEKGKIQTEPLLVFSLGEESISSGIWKIEDLEGKILSYGTIENWDGETIDSLVVACDTSISSAVASASEIPDKPTKQAIIGIPGNWMDGESFNIEKQKIINKLCSKLKINSSLSKFVIVGDAVAQYLLKTEGGLTSVILINIYETKITVSLIVNGKFFGSKLVDRSESLALDVDEGLQQFEYKGNFPTRFVLLGKGDLERSKQVLITYPWTDSQKNGKISFFQLPKIEIIDKNFEIDSLVIASGKEMSFSDETYDDKNLPKEDISFIEEEDIFIEKNNFGFIKEVDIVENDNLSSVTNEIETKKEEAVVIETGREVNYVDHNYQPAKEINFDQKRIRQRKLNLLPLVKKIFINKFLLIFLIIFCLISAGVFALFNNVIRADVQIFIKPFVLEKTFDFSVLTTKNAQIDIDKKIIPSFETTVELPGNKQINVKGKKIIGEKATGEVVIYNRTDSLKTIPKGTLIKFQDLKYLLDQEIKIASKTADLENGIDKWGEAKVKITAFEIGTQYNLGVNQTFVSENYPSSSFIIKNLIEISGGTSREIQAVSKEDKDNLQKSLEEELSLSAIDKVKEQIGQTDHLLEEFFSIKSRSLSYNKEIGDEASELSVEGKVTFAYFYFKDEDLKKIIDAVVENEIPQNYQKEPFSERKEFSLKDKNKKIYSAKIEKSYYPEINKEDLSLQLKMKTFQKVGEIIGKNTLISGYKIKMKPLFNKLNMMPFNQKNINIIVGQSE